MRDAWRRAYVRQIKALAEIANASPAQDDPEIVEALARAEFRLREMLGDGLVADALGEIEERTIPTEVTS